MRPPFLCTCFRRIFKCCKWEPGVPISAECDMISGRTECKEKRGYKLTVHSVIQKAALYCP